MLGSRAGPPPSSLSPHPQAHAHMHTRTCTHIHTCTRTHTHTGTARDRLSCTVCGDVGSGGCGQQGLWGFSDGLSSPSVRGSHGA